ncbi:MAG: hypothetical protein FWD01_01955 [Defluviitaleaceae bacterium]|nr:hypothetical protein [Defluviitaleaceae bacterium]
MAFDMWVSSLDNLLPGNPKIASWQIAAIRQNPEDIPFFRYYKYLQMVKNQC